MKWKYNLVFLFILSALALPEKLNAQHCLDFKYDKSGNRIEMFVHDCGFEYKEQTREMIDEEISEEKINEERYKVITCQLNCCKNHNIAHFSNSTSPSVSLPVIHL